MAVTLALVKTDFAHTVPLLGATQLQGADMASGVCEGEHAPDRVSDGKGVHQRTEFQLLAHFSSQMVTDSGCECCPVVKGTRAGSLAPLSPC